MVRFVSVMTKINKESVEVDIRNHNKVKLFVGKRLRWARFQRTERSVIT